MKIVVLDWNTIAADGDISCSELEKLGDVRIFPMTSPEQTVQNISDAEIVLCNKVLITRDVMDKCPNIKYIGLFATGYNNIDILYCRSRGITVCNAGSYSTNSVAQHTFALILEHYNKTAMYDQYVQQGRWKRSPTFSPFVYPLSELAGKTLGIVGLGAIGQAVAKIAVAFQMNVIAYNRSEKNIDGVRQTSLDELLKASDIVTVHCPLNSDSEKMFDSSAFSKMKQGALFVNTARGGVIVEKDLYDALMSGHLGGACIDTLSVEPMEENCILMGAKNCIITPHIAWAPIETRRRLLDIVTNNILQFLNGTPVNVVS